jgi:hypothetical protein
LFCGVREKRGKEWEGSRERSQEKLDLGRVGGRSKDCTGGGREKDQGPAVWEQNVLMYLGTWTKKGP